METIAQYLRESQDVKSIYAVVQTNYHGGDLMRQDQRVGRILTWSLSKSTAKRAVEKEWNPELWRVVKMTLIP